LTKGVYYELVNSQVFADISDSPNSSGFQIVLDISDFPCPVSVLDDEVLNENEKNEHPKAQVNDSQGQTPPEEQEKLSQLERLKKGLNIC